MAAQAERGVPLSAVCPKFLHTNSTSHTWPFSAIAELIDNAYDPDVKARQFWIDKTRVNEQDCLIFMDNGAGIEYKKMHKMLSFGFSDKQTINGHAPVGLYGNGFKSGSMRLGKDAIVFSKQAGTMCVGMLSQTYLQNIEAENVMVPIVMFKPNGSKICPEPEHEVSLQDILRHSLFQTLEELHSEFKVIDSLTSSSSTGTRIIIWNLRRMPSGHLEFDFERDRYDIRIPAEVYESTREQNNRLERGLQLVPESTYSLRAYCSILYLKPIMQIIIRGQKVKTQLVSKTLAHRVKDIYKPLFHDKPIPITFGYNTKNKEQYGIMMYHKNRLIKAYERVACQLRVNRVGVGVIGVIECDFLKPTHNKQDFDSTDEYRKTIYNVGIKLEEYWKEVRHRHKSSVPVEDTEKRPDQNWVQCDSCLKWRKLPDCIDVEKLPDKWFCHKNPDPQFRSCTVEQEAEDSDDEQHAGYQKTYKQHEKIKKLQQERAREQVEQQKIKAEQAKYTALEEQNALLKQQFLEQQLRHSQTPASSGSPVQAIHSSSLNASAVRRKGPRPSDEMPVITNVISLSRITPTRTKRGKEKSRENGELKRRRIMNGFSSNTPGSPSRSTASPASSSSPTMVTPNKADGKDEDDDEIVIIESSSTPRPIPATFDISKVKSEDRSDEEVPGIHVERSDDVGIETSGATETTAAANFTGHSKTISITTQTDQRIAVKGELDDSGVNKAEEGNMGGGKANNESEAKQGFPPLQRRTEQDPMNTESTREFPSLHVTKTILGKGNESESNCEIQQFHVKEEEPDDEELSTRSELEAERMSATLKDLHLLVPEPLQQQDSQVEHKEVAYQERDDSLVQAQHLTCQSSLLELNKRTVKKEQNTQTPTMEEEQDYKALYLQATDEMEKLRRELDQLRRERTEMETKAEVKEDEINIAHSTGGTVRLDVFNGADDELACQMDLLLRELDKRNKESEELNNKVDHLEDEKNTLMTCCETLQRDLQEMKRKSEEAKVSTEDREVQTEFRNSHLDESEAVLAGFSSQGRPSTSVASEDKTQGRPGREEAQQLSCRIRVLRRMVGRLLVTFVPALDLEQVNYDCEVIDEILGQVINELTCTSAAS